ncbi:Apoptosis inhibitor 5 [Actinomortierella wolfii]|nr:Apoptosis inhibitor 5 [Actinomortierella wolfii]
MADIDAIYNAYNEIRDAGENATQFPNLQNRAIDGLFDLCEDESAVIRQAAIKAIPLLVKEEPQYTIKLVDVLVQLLQLDVITVLFRQGLVGVELRKKSMEYITSLAVTAKNSLFKNPELEQLFVDEIIGVLNRGVSNTELEPLARIIMQTKTYETGKLNLDNLLALYVKHITSEKAYNAVDPESVKRVLVAGKVSMPLFKRAVSADPLLQFFSTYILEPQAYKSLNDKQKLSVLKLYADSIANGHPSASSWKQAATRMSDILILDVPAFGTAQTSIDFKRAECATLTLYSAAVKDPDVVTGEELTSRFKSLYAATQEEASTVKNQLAALAAKEKPGAPSEQAKAMNRTLLALTNTHTIVREFLKPRNSRNAKLALHPSWQPLLEPSKLTPQATVSATTTDKTAPGAKSAKDSKAPPKNTAKATSKPPTTPHQPHTPQQQQQSSPQQQQQQQGLGKRKQESDTTGGGGGKSKRTKILKRHGTSTGGGSPKAGGGHSPSHHQHPQTQGIQTLHSQSSINISTNSSIKQSHGSNGRAPPPNPFDSGSKKRRDQRDKGSIKFLQR